MMKDPALPDGITFKELTRPQEMRAVFDLELTVWGAADATPPNQLVISAKTGGHVIGAFAGEELVSFVYGFPAWAPGEDPWIASHMLGTRPDWRGKGLGQALKWRQRAWALDRGLRRITWTFDPLEAKNAHLNLNALGAVAETYIIDCYGPMEDKLNHGLPSDRLMAVWHLESERVQAAAEGRLLPEGTHRVAVPRDTQTLKQTDFPAAKAARFRVREALTGHLAAGRRVVGYDAEASVLLLK